MNNRRKKILFKIIPILILVLFVIMPFTNIAFAENDEFTFGSILTAVQEFFKKGTEEGNEDIAKTFIEKMAPLFSALYYIGLAVAVGVLIIIGVRYALASPDQKADLKERLVGFFIAVVILAAAVPIWKLVVRVFSDAANIKV